ncbi:MAG: site-specific DNA-methyltransferase [Cyanobacteria bacterium MAG CAR4_bin_6]|nr:site-specific DNA-methyltransferase [Cyanobacteria bacterium MAG CAR4_bin_6]
MPTLEFKGKQHVYAHHLTVPYRPLVPDGGKSLHPADVDDNLIIHGDNLHALKALLPRYAGKVKCIYIDPPYNTGNEGWVYNDNVNSLLMRQWLANHSPVDGEDLERHDKWLCMMWPRLHLLRELLADDGVIFISIDDNEQHHLRMVMDEIFGEGNLIGQFTWKKRSGANDAQNKVSIDHEYIVCYAKEDVILEGIEKDFSRYTNPDNDVRGPWTFGDLTCNKTAIERPNLSYPLTDPVTGITFECNSNRVWVFESDRMKRAIADDKVIFPANGKGTPKYKRHLLEVQSDKKPFSSWIETEMNFVATRKLREILQDQRFDYPKSVDLIKQLIAQGSSQDDIILDSFAGSATTAHAVLALNKEDGGNRKFILVECEDYADTITAERIRRVINGVPGARDQALREGLGGSFTYCTLGNPIDVEGMLTGESLPEYSQLAAYLLYTASGLSTSGKLNPQNDDGLFYRNGNTDYYLLYQPEIHWLRSNAAVLTEQQARRIHAIDRKAVMFAADKFMSQRFLSDLGITFCQIPYELHRNGSGGV